MLPYCLSVKETQKVRTLKFQRLVIEKKCFYLNEQLAVVNNEYLSKSKKQPSRQKLVPRTSRRRPTPTTSGRPLEMLFDHPGDIPK